MRKCTFFGLVTAFFFGLLLAQAQALADEPDPTSVPDEAVIGLTPVFSDGHPEFLRSWQQYLSAHLHRPVRFVHRNSYAEILDLLLSDEADFAWLCGYPYVQHRDRLRLVSTPIYRGKPLYRSYLIVPATDTKTHNLSDLEDTVFAFADPDSNSGYLYTRHSLTSLGTSPETFFGKTFYTWSHPKVIEAVATGLAAGGAVDGYVWETLRRDRPELIARTRVVERSPEFGFPPFVAAPDASMAEIESLREALAAMSGDQVGQGLLEHLDLDGFAVQSPDLYDGIARMAREAGRPQNR